MNVPGQGHIDFCLGPDPQTGAEGYEFSFLWQWPVFQLHGYAFYGEVKYGNGMTAVAMTKKSLFRVSRFDAWGRAAVFERVDALNNTISQFAGDGFVVLVEHQNVRSPVGVDAKGLPQDRCDEIEWFAEQDQLLYGRVVVYCRDVHSLSLDEEADVRRQPFS